MMEHWCYGLTALRLLRPVLAKLWNVKSWAAGVKTGGEGVSDGREGGSCVSVSIFVWVAAAHLRCVRLTGFAWNERDRLERGGSAWVRTWVKMDTL